MTACRAKHLPPWLLLTLAAGCARGNGGASAEPSPASSSVVVAAKPANSSVAVAAALAPAGTTWAAGQRNAFRLQLTSALAFGDQANKFDFTVTGKLVVAPTVVHGTDASLFIIFEKASIESRAPDPERQLQVIAEQLSKSGCYIEVANGQVTEMRFPPGLSPMVVSVYRTIVATLQVTVPTGKRDHFESQEHDGTGEYTAAYEGTGDRVWSKHKLSYSKLLSKAAGTSPATFKDIVPEIRSSSGEIQLAEDGRLVRVRSRDELKIRGAQVPVNSLTEVKLDADGVTNDAPVRDWRALGEPLTRLAADEPYVQAADRDAMSSSMDDARINGQSFEAVVEKLRATAVSREVAAQGNASKGLSKASDAAVIDQQETGQFVALAAMFRRRESDVAKAVKEIRTDPQMAMTLVDALSSSGSPAAHKALADMLTAKGIDPKLRQRALGGLALTRRPSPIAVQALKGELTRDKFSASALYGLGSYARYYSANGDKAQEQAIGEILLDRLRNTEDIVPRLVIVLQAIGNSGYQGALQDVTPRLGDRRTEVRAAAMRAVQLMPGPQIDQILADAITTDREPDVSVAAVASARLRKPNETLVRALSSVASSSKEAKVRYESVKLLGEWSKERADLRELMQRVAINDSEESIRRLAKSVL